MEALNLKWLSAMASFPVAAQAKCAETAGLRSAMTGLANVEGTGRAVSFKLLTVRVERFQRFDYLIVRDSLIRTRIKTKGWNGLDGEGVGRP
ncbi:hypothetical protein GCM10010520_53120 [Rhizobium viscosum]